MSSDRYVAERLPWYLNGTLDDAERAELEKLLAESEESRQDLENVREAARVYGHRLPLDVVVDYAFDGEHAEVPAELLRRYFAVSPVGSDELELVRESRRALEAEMESEREDRGGVALFPQPAGAPSVEAGWRRYALAASLVGALALGGLSTWQFTKLQQGESALAQAEQELREALAREAEVVDEDGLRGRVETLENENEQLAAGKSDLVDQVAARDEQIDELRRQIDGLTEPLMNIPVVDLYPGDMVLRGEPQADRLVVVPRQTRSVALILNSSVEKEQRVTGLEILDAGGSRVWSSPVVPERDELGTFTVALPVQELGIGRYTLQLVDGDEAATKVVESYQIEIR